MNWYNSERFCTESLESAAKRYKTLGFSIIPLHGATNPNEAKRPVVKWSRFQHVQPSDQELYTWFHGRDDLGIGIVCGRVSRLMVLDFDDAAVASEFRRLHPDLVETFTVQSGTRGLPHLYYRLPTHRLVTTTAYPGVDLRGEGAYVVAPPTRVGQAKWDVEVDAPMRVVSELDLRRIMGFLTMLKATSEQSAREDAVSAPAEASEFRRLPSDEALLDLYHSLCDRGRNQALFKTACAARDSDVLEAACCLLLAPAHAEKSSAQAESYATRYAEAVRTIASAYRRPARSTNGDKSTGLGRSVREWFLAQGMVSVARVLDGLYAVGVQPGTFLTEREICVRLASLKIGRRSVMSALKSCVDGVGIFAVSESPLNPPNDAYAASGQNALNHSCEMSRGATRVKNRSRGRPAQQYRLPAPDEVAVKLGIRTGSVDGLGDGAMASPRAYRQALHRELLARRPGSYARAWLAQRLGVSRWTTRRYEKAEGMCVTSAYTTQILAWRDVTKLPQRTADVAYGVFLERPDGKRFPAVRGLAMKLMGQGYLLQLKHQRPNFYAPPPPSVGIPTPQRNAQASASTVVGELPAQSTSSHQGSSVGIPTAIVGSRYEPPSGDVQPSSVGTPTPRQPEPTFWLCPECLDYHVMVDRPGACTRCHTSVAWEIIPQAVWRDPQTLQQWWQKRYRDHLDAKQSHTLVMPSRPATSLSAQARALVEKVHAAIPNLSFANACKLVRDFNAALIEKALVAIRHRSGVRSPAGFLITYLKSEQQLLLKDNKGKPEGLYESSIDWVKRLAKSKYITFLSNADEILSLDSGGGYGQSPA